jgi:hypothetical protein
MRVLTTVVEIATLTMLDPGQKLTLGGAILVLILEFGGSWRAHGWRDEVTERDQSR